MDDDENEKDLIGDLVRDMAAHKAALLAILQAVATQNPATTQIVLQDLAEAEHRLNRIDPKAAAALSDLIAEIEVRIG